jgi:D-hexose-6-phosphate mutarotase
LTIQKEENRRYIGHSAECIIEDTGYNRKIRIAKKGSNVTVVWNPWEGAKDFADMQADDYRTMVCVEAVNAYNDIAILAPGQSFSISTIIGLV